MAAANFGYWEDFEVGQRYPTTSRKVTEEDHLQFCKLVGYNVPLFLDEEYAKTTSYGGRICPSHLTLSFSTAMTGRLFSDTVIALLALERGKFFRPVRPGDTISTEVEVVAKKSSSDPSRGVIVFRDHVTNQHNEIVLQVDKVTLLKRRSD
jgi:acyl dehydratase